MSRFNATAEAELVQKEKRRKTWHQKKVKKKKEPNQKNGKMEVWFDALFINI